MIRPAARRLLPAALLGLLIGSSAAPGLAWSQDLSEPTQAQPELQKQPLTIVSRGGVRHPL